MLIIALAQIQMGFNVSAIPVSIGKIVEEFDTSPTTVGTALVVYSLAVASLVMLGAKVSKPLGARLAFQIGVAAHGLSMALMALSPNTTMIYLSQALAGVAAALIVPTLVVLIANHYKGAQQAQSLGLLGAAQAAAGILAFLVVGVIGTLVGWRPSFWLITAIAAIVFLLSFRFKPVERDYSVKIDWIGALLAAIAITLISLGFNNLKAWGMLLASPDAPVSFLGVSPSLVMILVGVIFGQGFFAWSHRRYAQGKSPLLAPEVLDTPQERAATYCLFIIAALGPAINFLIPLYIQIVQGGTSMETSVTVIPYSLAIFFGTAMIVRLFDRLTSRTIGRLGFSVVGVGLVLLAYAIQNDWGSPWVIFSLIVIGLGEGSLLTLVFNVLVSASPKKLAGDVGALRGTVNNLATGLGTAFASVLAVSLLSMIILQSLDKTPILPKEVVEEKLELDNIDFVSNEDLDDLLKEIDLTPQQEATAVEINVQARLLALKISFLVLAGVAFLAIIPSGGLPDYLAKEIPADKL
jgi:MFS family permease